MLPIFFAFLVSPVLTYNTFLVGNYKLHISHWKEDMVWAPFLIPPRAWMEPTTSVLYNIDVCAYQNTYSCSMNHSFEVELEQNK